MRVRTFLLCLGCALLLALPVLAQGIPTGTLSGRVSADKQTLPGVTVSVSSPALQGKRSATTNSNGDYTVPLLPPGDYQVTFDIEGFQSAQRSIKVNAAQNAELNVTMSLAGVAETIEVVGNYETISSATESQSTYSKTFIEGLPMERNVRETVLLNAGVNDNGPGGAITIAGSQSYESLYLVNGVVVNENLRGQPLNLFIEDAIEETTTSVSGISAEYGRFAGGVVNTITKSGGNELSGSLRTNFTNDKWIGKTPLTTADRIDKINKRYEGTLGGWVVKDRLWYFLAARQFKTSFSAQTTLTNIPYQTEDKELRSEGKVTFSPFEGHRLIGSYIKIKRDNNGNTFGTVLDLASVDNRKLPQDLKAANYTGVLSDNFFVEGQYSKRYFAFVGSGSDFTDLIKGTWIEDNNTGYRYNSPTFCGVCGDETRSNEDYLAKASWFLSTGSLGSHDVAFGYDSFNDQRKSNNFQSGSNFSLFSSDTIIRGQTPIPVFVGDGQSAFIVYWPVLNASKGTNFKTNSLYANDRWRLNNKLSFNVGVRYDKNDGKDAEGKKIANDSKISPRLGASYDLKGDGDVTFNLSYAEYVTAIANTQGDASSSAGTPAIFVWVYEGPDINTGSTLVPTATVIQNVFNWFNSTGGINGNTVDLVQVTIPGATTVIPKSLQSPYAREISLGVTKRLGSRGLARIDLVDRKFGDFYSNRTDLSTGRVNTSSGPADLAFLENLDNSRILERKYRGIHTQFQYRFTDRLNLGLVYTLSKTEGNFNGETSGSGPVASGVLQYQQYKQASWNSPKGYLNIDQRHRARLFGTFDIFKTDHNHLSLGFVQQYQTGTPYGAVGSVDTRRFVTNPGYAIPPSSVTYFYTSRDAFRTDTITATDLTLNYAWTWNAFSKNIEVFVQPEVLNVFGEHGVVSVNTTVRDATTSGAFARFNPFTTTPVEGVNWAKGANFGKPTNPASFQTPRTFRFSLGFRF